MEHSPRQNNVFAVATTANTSETTMLGDYLNGQVVLGR